MSLITVLPDEVIAFENSFFHVDSQKYDECNKLFYKLIKRQKSEMSHKVMKTTTVRESPSFYLQEMLSNLLAFV